MSEFQRAQMYSLTDANIHNIAINGMFDDCQDIVKALQQDAEFKAAYNLGTVNSINWGRILAQIVYYFKAYFAVTTSNDKKKSALAYHQATSVISVLDTLPAKWDYQLTV